MSREINQEMIVRQSAEWQALNKLWKACSSEQQENCSEEFKILAEFIRTKLYVKKDENRKKQSKNKDTSYLTAARYLAPLSNDARQFIIDLLDKGEKNIYHSVMAVLDKHPDLTKEEVTRYYFDKYEKRRPFLAENKGLVCEIINLCWERQRRKRVRH